MTRILNRYSYFVFQSNVSGETYSQSLARAISGSIPISIPSYTEALPTRPPDTVQRMPSGKKI